jgi:hypothetical protein
LTTIDIAQEVLLRTYNILLFTMSWEIDETLAKYSIHHDYMHGKSPQMNRTCSLHTLDGKSWKDTS